MIVKKGKCTITTKAYVDDWQGEVPSKTKNVTVIGIQLGTYKMVMMADTTPDQYQVYAPYKFMSFDDVDFDSVDELNKAFKNVIHEDVDTVEWTEPFQIVENIS